MQPNIVLRDEVETDAAAIAEVTIAAFETLAISNHTEQFIIEALRAAKALTLSLVAELDGKMIGQVAFSPVTIADGTPNWYGLGPISVLPAYQLQGIGTALIHESLSRLKNCPLLAVVWWGIRSITHDSGSPTAQGFSWRGFRRRSSLLYPLLSLLLRVLFIFTRPSWQRVLCRYKHRGAW